MNIFMFLSESEFEEDGFDNEVLMSILESEYPPYALDLKWIQEAQLNNERLNEIVKKHFSSNGNNETVYTYKPVEDVDLIHQNNQILVTQSKQQSVLDWYHDILIHPGEKRMIATIKLVFTWSGLNKQVIEY